VLSRSGSQKLVFLATWLLTQREVVLKKVTGSPESIERIVARESQSHPLSTVHDNIIKTHELQNAAGERFLVEERLPIILSDGWRSQGSGEAANLLYDIANALNYLHTELDWVHGDVKPDNIGQKESRYILLDFGICRPAAAFTVESTATGSLRTRAPELLTGEGYVDPKKVDIWALGATVFNAIQERYPLFERGEQPPRISSPEQRQNFEKVLADRVRTRWNELVDLKDVSEPLKSVLMMALEPDPSKRCSASQLLKKAEADLSVFLRRPSSAGPFSPLDELQQLRDYLPQGHALKLMPLPHKNLLQAKLKDLQRFRGLSTAQKSDITQLLNLIS
jgi:serine/threonine protein kinase